jgi:hypothetical protein
VFACLKNVSIEAGIAAAKSEFACFGRILYARRRALSTARLLRNERGRD